VVVIRHAVNLHRWLEDHGPGLAAHLGRVLLVVVLALLARALLHRAVARLIRTAVTGGALRPLKDKAMGTVFDASPLLSERRRQRTQTLGSVLRSIASFTVATVAGTMVLAELGVNLTPVVASAGILGVAVGFGAQNLVKDFLAGMFMLLEDQYGVGDVVDAGAATGTVEAVTLRTTRLRDVDGTVWHLRNGEIARVGNKSQGWARALVDVPLSLSNDLAAVRALVVQVAADLAADPAWAAKVLEAPEVWGFESLGPTGAVLRVALKTAPLERSAVERELRERAVRACAEHGVALGA
jgi:small conductance mechanosensitive channel